jgi:hypothetical protein
MILTNGKEFVIDGSVVKVTITDRISNCNGCFLKGEMCRKRSNYSIKNCYIGNSPIIFEEVINETLKQEIETLLNLKIDKSKILERYNLTEEKLKYIVDKKI